MTQAVMRFGREKITNEPPSYSNKQNVVQTPKKRELDLCPPIHGIFMSTFGLIDPINRKREVAATTAAAVALSGSCSNGAENKNSIALELYKKLIVDNCRAARPLKVLLVLAP